MGLLFIFEEKKYIMSLWWRFFFVQHLNWGFFKFDILWTRDWIAVAVLSFATFLHSVLNFNKLLRPTLTWSDNNSHTLTHWLLNGGVLLNIHEVIIPFSIVTMNFCDFCPLCTMPYGNCVCLCLYDVCEVFADGSSPFAFFFTSFGRFYFSFVFVFQHLPARSARTQSERSFSLATVKYNVYCGIDRPGNWSSTSQ